MALSSFHPALQDWFRRHLGEPTPVQAQAWPSIRHGLPTLIAAPTGSGKTLAAFLCAIDDLLQRGIAGALPDQSRVLYISPLKALSNDVQKNLSIPINGIRDRLLERGIADVNIRAWVRSGDTPPGERTRMLKTPPHIVVTTPESLSILLGSDSGRQMLQHIETVIVDEVHALAGNKRGAHLSLSLQRLERICKQKPRRIGLSATQKPISEVANYLMADQVEDCVIVDSGHRRAWDLRLELPDSPLQTVMAAEEWEELYNKLTRLVEAHRTTLIFVNTRRMAERVAHRLGERLGEQAVTAHHGSLSREHRLHAEQRLKNGQLQALVATASLELGIDIGDIDLVCQLGSPRAINSFLQRVGRAGHQVNAVSKGCLFPLSRDDLVECTALLQSVKQGQLDHLEVCACALDVMAQHIVAEVAAQECSVDDLYDSFCRAYSYRQLDKNDYLDVVQMLADGYTSKRGRRAAYLHFDRVNGVLRARRGARLTAIMNMGAIPDQFDYDVILLPEAVYIGNLNEDFAFESLPGDIFLLGNNSYQIERVQQGKVYVHDAHGAPPNLPFWLGEAPGRSNELSTAVSELRHFLQHFQQQRYAHEHDDMPIDQLATQAAPGLSEALDITPVAAHQLYQYLALASACFRHLPTREHIVMERFFDESGDMHLVIHSVYGSRINRAWGLALRKRFCRKFNFELQAAADDDHIILSLGPTHSFPLQEVQHYLKSTTVRDILIQALLDAPVFATRWRWNCNISLAVPRMRSGKRVPAQFQRNDAEDLVALVFPDQLACLENISGNREIPEHPLVKQTLHDCVQENMDVAGLESLLRALEAGQVSIDCYDLSAPSPLAESIINANPYAFLDGAPAEERRTLAINQTPVNKLQQAAQLANIQAQVIQQVCASSWPLMRNADELHDALNWLAYLSDSDLQREANPVHAYGEELIQQQRACRFQLAHQSLWVARERLDEFIALYGPVQQPALAPLAARNRQSSWDKTQALTHILHSRLEAVGPVTAQSLASELQLPLSEVEQALLQLENNGSVFRGLFATQGQQAIDGEQWCERRLLARIQQQNRQFQRRLAKPVAPAQYMRFLFQWQGLADKGQQLVSLMSVLEQLEGIALSPASWENHILPQRISAYTTNMLDELCASGRISWLRPTSNDTAIRKQAIASTPIALIPRLNLLHWLAPGPTEEKHLSAAAYKLLQLLRSRGALFFSDLVAHSGLLRSQVETALGLLVAQGFISADHFTGIRALVAPNRKKPRLGAKHSHPRNIEHAGRWWILPHVDNDRQQDPATEDARLRHICLCLLRRYGVVFRKLLEKETQLPPWRTLLYQFRRMEDRGEILGGRFVEYFAGEQFALREAAYDLRRANAQVDDSALYFISASDPLNLCGIVTGEEKINSHAASQIAYYNGVAVAWYDKRKKQSQIQFLQADLSAKLQDQIVAYWRGAVVPAPSQTSTPKHLIKVV